MLASAPGGPQGEGMEIPVASPELSLALARAALAAGAAILRHAGGVEATAKADGSPVTVADAEAETIILAALAALLPGVSVVAEESAAREGAPAVSGPFILVDPLDGTRDFVAGRPEYTVNIALIVAGCPVLGVVYAPALSRLWLGDSAGARCADIAPGGDPARAGWQPMAVRKAPATGLTALVSRSHATPETEAHLARWPVAQRLPSGSSLKFCLIGEGKGDLYPRFGPTMEWDTAAGDAVLRAAGGGVFSPEGGLMTYGHAARGYRNGDFVALGDLTLVENLKRHARS